MSANLKHLSITVTGKGGDPNQKEVKQIDIEPGTTPGDVLRSLDLSGYVLSSRTKSSFNDRENLYPLVQDGEDLNASPVMSAGA